VSEGPPTEVTRWAAERAAARASRDFGRADELRGRIAGAGWEVVDQPGSYTLRPLGPVEAGPALERISDTDRPGPPPVRRAASVLVDVEGWPDDVARFLASLARHRPSRDVEVVALDRSATPHTDWPAAWDGPLRILVPETHPGFGAARNAALRRAAGEVVVVVDTSLELTGDLLGPLLDALADPAVAVAGPFGLTTADLRDYEERTGGEVAAVQGYALAARRSDLLAVGGFREAFSYYRNADIDLSLRLRDLGQPPHRALAVGADRCRRHAHRAWEATAPEDRDRLSRKNMARVLKRFGHRLDLAVRPAASA
jgi:hypothetical protein